MGDIEEVLVHVIVNEAVVWSIGGIPWQTLKVIHCKEDSCRNESENSK